MHYTSTVNEKYSCKGDGHIIRTMLIDLILKIKIKYVKILSTGKTPYHIYLNFRYLNIIEFT